MIDAPQLAKVPDNLLPILRKPSGFAAAYLGLDLYPWQIQYLNQFETITYKDRERFALSTPNGAGKSSMIVAALILWWLWRWPKGKVIVTTKDSKQLDSQVWPAIEPKIRNAFGPAAHVVSSPYYEITTPTGGRAILYTTNDPARVEGHHPDGPDGPVLMIADEAKSIDDLIFEAIDRCTYNALLYVSSPGLMMGRFWEASKKNRRTEENPTGFIYRQVSLRECPHITPQKIAQMAHDYGVNSPLYRSSVEGEFMDQDAATPYVFPLAVVNRNYEDRPQFVRGDRTAFCDFAAGGDENVLALREGNRITIEAAWRERDTMAAVGRFLLEFKRLGLKEEQIFADRGGLGLPMIDALRRVGFELQGVNNGARALDPAYENRGSEIWHTTAMAATRGELILPDDESTKSQLVSRKSEYTKTGKLALESKADMAKRGVKSPDRADAVCGAWASKDMVRDKPPTAFDNMTDWENEGEFAGVSYPPGTDPGY